MNINTLNLAPVQHTEWVGCLRFTQDVEGLTTTGGTCLNDFSGPVNQDILIQCTLSWKIVVSELWSVIAALLNLSGGVHLIRLAKLYMCMQKYYKHNEDTHMVPGVHSHGSILLSTRGTSLQVLDYNN